MAVAVLAALAPLATAHATARHPVVAAHVAAVTDQRAAAAHPRVSRADLASAKRTRSLWRQWTARVLQARAAAGGSVMVVVFGSFGDDATPIADVNHDRAQEVLQARSTSTTPAVVVLSGAGGRPLWSLPTDGLIGAEYAAVPGSPGIVLVYSSGSGADIPGAVAEAGASSFVVTALDAATGRSLWSQTFPSTFAFSDAGGEATDVEPDALLARKGAAPLLLLTNVTFTEALVSGGMATQSLVLDTATGKVTGGGMPNGLDDGFVYDVNVGDVDGDGTDDVATVDDGAAPTLALWSVTKDTPMWATTFSGGAFVNFVGGSPDINGDKKGDVLLSVEGDSGIVQAVVGSSGSVIWQHAGDFAQSIGDVDHDGRSDTRVVTFDRTMGYAAVDAAGRTLWRRSVSSPSGPSLIPLSYPAGDVNADGVGDIYLRYVDKEGLFGAPKAAAGSALIDGATGSLHRQGDLGVPLGDSLDGHGADFYRAVQAKHALRMTATDGRSRHALWTRTLPGTVQWVGDAEVAVLGAHAQPGLVDTFVSAGRESVVAQDGRHGLPVWRSDYDVNGAGAFGEAQAVCSLPC